MTVLKLGDRRDYVEFGHAFGTFELSGGPGRDELTYNAHDKAHSVAISLDGRPNDGASSDRGNVRPDVENIALYGDRLRSRVIGSSRRNEISVDHGGTVSVWEVRTSYMAGAPSAAALGVTISTLTARVTFLGTRVMTAC